MKFTASILTTAFLALMVLPSTAAASAYRYSSRHPDGWPKWVGRVAGAYQKPVMAPKYLPLSLLKTGRFTEMVEEVKSTPSVDKTD
jgi:hypothetical protein